MNYTRHLCLSEYGAEMNPPVTKVVPGSVSIHSCFNSVPLVDF